MPEAQENENTETENLILKKKMNILPSLSFARDHLSVASVSSRSAVGRLMGTYCDSICVLKLTVGNGLGPVLSQRNPSLEKAGKWRFFFFFLFFSKHPWLRNASESWEESEFISPLIHTCKGLTGVSHT